MSDPTKVSRRLVAVFAADVEAYSRLMGTDEVGTLKGLTERRAILDKLIGDHGGRIANTAGDSVLAEFGSAVEAVQCAVEAQNALAEANSGIAADRRISFRIGIHVGDVMVRAGDLFGDGVNIAARLQALAQPGGVCVSGTTYEQVRKVLPVAFTDMGLQQVKNIEDPIRAYRIGAPSETQEAAPTRVAEAESPPPLPDKPSIAVLPFQNMSGDPEQDYFADGMVEEIITALSRFSSLFVIARNSSFTYRDKGKAVGVKQVGYELGVRYVLEGSIRKAGGRVRITGQLIDAPLDRHMWADKFDGALEDVFALQDRITAGVVSVIAPKIEQAEIERARQKPTDKLDGYDLFLRGLALTRKWNFGSETREFFQRAYAKDPEYAAAYAMDATVLMARHSIYGQILSPELRAEAIRLAEIAAMFANDDANVLARSAHVQAYFGQAYDRAAAMADRAVIINPNLAIAWFSRGCVAVLCSDADRALESFDRMTRLSPLDPLRVTGWVGGSLALFFSGRYEEGCTLAKKAIEFGRNPQSLGAFIANSSRGGRTDEAREAMQQLLRIAPDFRASHVPAAFPTRNADWHSQLTMAFRAAGLPEG
jgi:adenylate cyclase